MHIEILLFSFSLTPQYAIAKVMEHVEFLGKMIFL